MAKEVAKEKETDGDMGEIRALFGVDAPPATPGTDSNAAAPEEAPASPTRTKVYLGGRELEVDPDIADAIRSEIDTKAGRYGSELQRMREQIARLEGATM